MELRNLQVIRAIAAMMVVLNHFWRPVFGWLFLGIGGMGVDGLQEDNLSYQKG